MSPYSSTLVDAYLYGFRLVNAYNSIYLQAFQKAIRDATNAVAGGGASDMLGFAGAESLYERWLKNADEGLEAELKSEHFTSLLSRYTRLLLELRSHSRNAGHPVDYFDRLFDWHVRSRMVFSLVPKESHLAPFDVIYRKGKARLLHYRGQGAAKKQALLIVYAPINTFHILDLNPDRSVVRNLLSSGGLDIYLLDWGYPDWGDNHLSLDDYLGYMDDAVSMIKDQDKESTVSILGYCWGGIFSLVYSALKPENVRNLVLLAAPVDFSKDETVLARWAKTVDIDAMMDEFGHMDGQALNVAFLMRNPPRYAFDKYLKLFQRLYDSEFVDMFIDVERWLYDSPIIPGVLHRQIINDCYRNNQLISNGIEVTDKGGRKQKADLKRISMPVLSIIAENDDLVSPASSTAIIGHVSSKDASTMMNPGGHVALCISGAAHRNLWSKVAKWLILR